MTSRRGWLCPFAGIVILLCVIPDVNGLLSINNCPMEVVTTRSDLVYWTSPTVTTDQPHGFTLVRDHLPGRYYYENTTVTYTATDGNETKLCVFNIGVVDNGSPVIISCPSDITATPVFGQTQVSVTWPAPGLATTDFDESSTKRPGDQFDIGRTIVKYTFMNSVASSFCTFDVFVNEPAATTVPTITCPANIDVALPIGEESTPVTWDDPVYPTNLGSVTLTCGRTKGDAFFVGINTITCIAYFESNEAKMCSFNVAVTETQDTENPSILNCPTNIYKYVANTEAGAIVTWVTPTITDNSMTNLNLIGTHTNGEFYNIGVYDVTYTGTDGAGNTVTCTFQINVEVDDLSPTFVSCPASPLVVYVRADQGSGVVTWVEPTAIDNSMSVTLAKTGVANGATLTAGAAPETVSYTATDGFNNENKCEFTVSVVVDQSPTYIGCPTDMTVDAAPGVNYANVTWPEPSATDDRSGNSLTLTKSHEPGQDLQIGDHIVQYTATDEVGNVGTCTFMVTVRDDEAPVLAPCPASDTYNLAQSQSTVDVTWMNPTATDNSGQTPTVTTDRNPGPYTAGVYTVTVTATDGASKAVSCTFTITVNAYVPDTSSPTWSSCPPSTSLNTDNGVGTAAFSWTVPTASDDRVALTTFVSHTPPFNFPIGINDVRYSATDTSGNTGECTFTVTVADNQAPVWTSNTGCGTTITHYVLNTRTDDLEILITNPVATDNSGIAPTITKQQNNQATPTLFPVGNTVIIYTATDGSSNTISNCMITVQVIQATTTWSPQGSITFTHIRGQTSGLITSAGSNQLLSELASDMDKLFRRTSVGAQFAGVNDLSRRTVDGNTVVTFHLHFTRNGRYTSFDLKDAFNSALTGANQQEFATANLVVANSFNLHVREFKLTTRLIRLDADTNPPFLNNYNNPTSNEFTVLANRLNDELDKAFLGSFNYLVSTVVAMRPGSIIQDTILVFDDTSVTTEMQIVDLFNGKLNTPGELGIASGLYYDRIVYSFNQELCPLMECNDGTCSVSSNYTNVCTCPAGFTGTRCEAVTTTELSPLALAAIIGGAVLLLILVFALLCCCMYCLRTPLKPSEQYPMERPFHFLDDEASVASSMDIFMLPRKRERSYLPALPPPAPPTLHIETDDQYLTSGPSFSPDGEVYVTGPNQVAIRPSSKRYSFY